MAVWDRPIGAARAARHARPRHNWVREILSPAEAESLFPRLWEIADALVPGLTDDQLARVVSLVADTCPSCHQDNAGCGCGRRARVPAGADLSAVLTAGQRRIR